MESEYCLWCEKFVPTDAAEVIDDGYHKLIRVAGRVHAIGKPKQHSVATAQAGLGGMNLGELEALFIPRSHKCAA